MSDSFTDAIDLLPYHLRAAAYLSAIDPEPFIKRVYDELKRLEDLLDEDTHWRCDDCGRLYSDYIDEPAACSEDGEWRLCRDCSQRWTVCHCGWYRKDKSASCPNCGASL